LSLGATFGQKIIQDKANVAGAPLSEYGRKILLSGSIIKVERDEKNPELDRLFIP
jgi:hypothetical protein